MQKATQIKYTEYNFWQNCDKQAEGKLQTTFNLISSWFRWTILWKSINIYMNMLY